MESQEAQVKRGVSKDELTIEQKKKSQMMMIVFKTMTAMKLTKEDGVAAEIIDGLYLGSIGAAYNKESLEKSGITHILTCADNLRPRYENDFKYLGLPLLDTPSQDLFAYFEKANTFITEAFKANDFAAKNIKNRVLVHCFAGKSRSTSFVLSYLMEFRKMNLKDAYALVKSKRPIAEPNPGFMLQLIKLEMSLFGINSFKQDALGTIEPGALALDESEVKEISDGIQQMKLKGDFEGAEEIQEKMVEVCSHTHQKKEDDESIQKGT